MMRDKSYQRTRLGKDVVAYLAWKRAGNFSERTLDQYERDLRLVCFAVGCGVKGVTHPDLMLVLENLPPGSWGRARAAWANFFKWAVREGMRPDNPVDRLPPLRRKPDPVYEIWDQDELDLLAAGTRSMESPLRERLRVLTMIESGARAAEMLDLQLRHFDLARKAIKVTGKGRKERLIPISQELSQIVDEYLLTEYPPPCGRLPALTDYLWYPVWLRGTQVLGLRPERRLGYGGFWRWWKRVEEAAGVDHKKPHMTRHTFATDVLDATDGDIYAVKELLGHTSTRTTEIYLHSSRTRGRAAIDALGAYRRGEQ